MSTRGECTRAPHLEPTDDGIRSGREQGAIHDVARRANVSVGKASKARQGHFGAVDWGALQASVIISIIPCLAVYLALQRYYISGLLSGAVK